VDRRDRRVLVIGKNFGGAIATLLVKNGVDVTLPYRPGGKLRPVDDVLARNLHTPTLEDFFATEHRRFDFCVIATPMADLVGVAEKLKKTNVEIGTFVLVQKAMDEAMRGPYAVASEVLPGAEIILCTGAAFAGDLANGCYTRMLLTHREGHCKPAEDFARLFAGGHIQWHYYDNFEVVTVCNTVRTVTSYLLGAVTQYLREVGLANETTLANVVASIQGEGVEIVHALLPKLDPTFFRSKIGWIMLADMGLCQSSTSRNRAAGEDDVMRHFHGSRAGRDLGVVEALANTGVVAQGLERRPGDWMEQFPYTASGYLFRIGTYSIEDAARKIFKRIQGDDYGS